ncbi:MAG: L,D-transpeptidase [Actinobacteria bacterium]|nr:L,D-transpeptidase [Actinomycetota bacterium]
MTRAFTTVRWPLAAAAALLLALAAAFAPGAGAGPSTVSTVDVVGSGTLSWKRVAVHAQPTRESKIVAVLREFRPDFSPQYVLALSQVRHPKTENPTWYRISVPGRPNGRTGWVPAGAVELRPVRKRLVVDRSERRFEFWDGDRLVRSGKVAVGAPGAETPTGLFYVQSKFTPAAEILGAYAFETSAYSKLSDWPGGGIVGVHGTPQPWLLGQAVSHGCVRLHNDDVRWLRSRMPAGTPIKIVR